jgi:ribosomal protein S7
MVITMKKPFERRLINAFMKKGKYVKAERIYFTVLNRLTSIGIVNPYKFLRETLVKMTPVMGVVKKKRGAKELVYPKYLEPRIGEKFAIQWLLKKIAKQKGSELINEIVAEFLKASKNQGEVVKEKWALYREVRYAVSFLRYTSKKRNFTFVERKLKSTKRNKWY